MNILYPYAETKSSLIHQAFLKYDRDIASEVNNIFFRERI